MIDRIDILVARRLREFRVAAKLSTTQLADKLGIPLRHIELYEAGEKRIGSAELYRFSLVLKVSVNSFFDGAASVQGSYRAPSIAHDVELLKLVQFFDEVSDRWRGLVLNIAALLAEAEPKA